MRLGWVEVKGERRSASVALEQPAYNPRWEARDAPADSPAPIRHQVCRVGRDGVYAGVAGVAPRWDEGAVKRLGGGWVLVMVGVRVLVVMVGGC